MKGIGVFLALLAAGSPVMATVTISLVDNGDLTAELVMVCDGDDLDALGNSKIAGVALEVSVDSGVIVDVPARDVMFPNGYKVTGESVVGDKGFGIFPGTITFTGGDPEDIQQTGTPVAPADAPDHPGQLGTSSIVLEFAALYDEGVPETAPSATTGLCTIVLSEPCNVTLRTNELRGGVVHIGGEPVVPILESHVIPPDECMRETAPEYERWVQFGRPACWCYKWQCKGDANGKSQGNVITRHWPVGTHDIDVLLTAYLVREANIGDVGEGVCADFNHASQGNIVTGYYPVGTDDIAILLDNYLVREADLPHCDAEYIRFWLTP